MNTSDTFCLKKNDFDKRNTDDDDIENEIKNKKIINETFECND